MLYVSLLIIEYNKFVYLAFSLYIYKYGVGYIYLFYFFVRYLRMKNNYIKI